MVHDPHAPQGNEASKIAHLTVPYTLGRGLDIGCGQWKLWPHCIGVDSGKDYGGQPVTDIRAAGDSLPFFASESMDFVFSSHFLEHVHETKACLAEWWRVIKPGGHLVMYLPHKNYYPNIGQPHANPDHKHDFLPGDILQHMIEIGRETSSGWDCLEFEDRGDRDEYSFFQVYRKRDDAEQHMTPWTKPEKSLLVVRYGAFGDQIMASAILPGLKAQGWHITYQTTPKGMDIVRHDPNIDAFWLQDQDHIPNEQLGPYWMSLSERFDKIVNLSESVEGTLLAIPGRIQHAWSDETRRKVLNVNYLERHADIAGVPKSTLAPRFYATDEDRDWVKGERDAMGEGPVVLWCLAGSSLHKMWPWVDVAIAWLMEQTDIKIVMAGGPREAQLEDAVLERVHEHCPERASGRLFRTCGRWSIRQTLAFAQESDMVVGPETGVLNAVCMLDMPKVVLLSHSSINNLTRDWNNTVSLTADVPCYPCHRLHYDDQFCPMEESTAAAACASAITPERVFGAVVKKLGLKSRQAAA